MKQIFTKNLLIKYIYNETTSAETLTVEDALNTDYDLYEHYCELYDSYKALPKATFSPSQEAISNVLAYSRSAQMALR